MGIKLLKLTEFDAFEKPQLATYKEAIMKKSYQIVAPNLIMRTALIIAVVFFITGCQSKMEEPKTTPLKLTISVDPC
jgi:hypothetical protein